MFHFNWYSKTLFRFTSTLLNVYHLLYHIYANTFMPKHYRRFVKILLTSRSSLLGHFFSKLFKE